MDELQKHQARETSLTLSDKTKQLAKVVVDVNSLIAFKREASDIIEWSKDIERLAPEATPEQIQFVMDCFKTGALEWDKQEGIQNIFRGIKLTHYEEKKWKIRKQNVY